MTEFIYEAGFERDHTHGQTLFPRHQQVGLGQSKATPAETDTAVSLSQRGTGLGSAVMEPGTPAQKAGSPALNEGKAQPERRRAGEVHYPKQSPFEYKRNELAYLWYCRAGRPSNGFAAKTEGDSVYQFTCLS